MILIIMLSIIYIKSRYTIYGKISDLNGPLIIFDFDGVICDSYDYMLHAFNGLAPKYKLNLLNPDKKPYYKKLSSRAFLKEAGVGKLQLPKLVKEIRKDMAQSLKDIPPFIETIEVIKALQKNGYTLAVITSNSIENVQTYLNNYNVSALSFIISTGPFAKHKAFKSVIKTSGVNASDIYYIGDETRDIEAGKKHQIKTIAVTWGYQAKELLAKFKPDFLLDKPKDNISSL